ncbi:class I SAM-dependent methyltransferase [Alicyclobacillus ferrooxydans]|uniref:class I SAM-dependent methyltransferase n=1 Tax=Alicyclobacillus ferrooxydans TaxID=471514 RepID=UPI0006D5467F|nr:class I SAM-dependent methyltransferase [Alicyclobacillus ferrooxydans]
MVNNAVDFFDRVGQTDWQQSLQRTLVHWIGIHPRHDVLDVGCGAGHFVILLAQRAGFVTGVDVSEEMVNRASRNVSDYGVDNAAIVPGRIQQLPFPADRFDIVTCLHLLFMYDDPSPLVGELLRVCKPGGQVVLLEPSSKLNPWSAQTYCAQNKLYDFERDSLLSFATAAARYRRNNAAAMEQAVHSSGVVRVDTSEALDGLASLIRLEKPMVDAKIVG